MIISLPLIAHWCFLYDGVFVGLTRAVEMRNTMIMSVLFGFIHSVFLWGAKFNKKRAPSSPLSQNCNYFNLRQERGLENDYYLLVKKDA